jgi:phosphoserine phosphatase
MTHVATLVGPPDALTAATLALVRAALPGTRGPKRLGPEAADISFSLSAGIDQSAMAEHLRDLIPGIDVVVQPAANRRRKLLLADMDSTMIGQECIDELADFVGLKAHVAAITERAMRGEIAFEPALRERVALLEGLPVKVIDDVIRNHITLTPGGRTLVATMRASGAYTCMVSGGFTLFTQPIGAMIGFDDTRANTLIIDDDLFAGRVKEPIFGREQKRATLIELRARLGLTQYDTLVVGDGANDMAMIAEAGLGVAYHAKPAVATTAPARIDNSDLTALLYVQGYSRDEFVAD